MLNSQCIKKTTAMKEDPLERLDRLEKEKKTGSNTAKTVMIALIALCVALGAALAYIWLSKASLVKDLNVEKEELTEQIIALQGDYENLSSDYENINVQLDSSREEVAQLVERIQQTEATNRAKMRQYEKELGTLRSIMRNYIVQIDSLNTLNHQLTAEAAAARQEAATSKRENEALSQQVEALTGQVAAGSVIKARGLRLEAMNSSDKTTDRSSRVIRLITSLSLVENELAPKGPVRVYIRVYNPEGQLLVNSYSIPFTVDGERMEASASREVDYNGKEVEMSIYLNEIPEFHKGIYSVEAFTEQGLLGSAELLLR